MSMSQSSQSMSSSLSLVISPREPASSQHSIILMASHKTLVRWVAGVAKWQTHNTQNPHKPLGLKRKYLDSKGLMSPTKFLNRTDWDCFGLFFRCAGYKKGYKAIREPRNTPDQLRKGLETKKAHPNSGRARFYFGPVFGCIPIKPVEGLKPQFMPEGNNKRQKSARCSGKIQPRSNQLNRSSSLHPPRLRSAPFPQISLPFPHRCPMPHFTISA
jgi:hypothetical protein